MRPRVVAAVGTRPEAIKLAPVVAALGQDPDLEVRLLVTGQHGEIAGEVLQAFGLAPDADLEVLRPGQPLASLAARALEGVRAYLEHLRPALVVVQGDTTTTFACALAAFYASVPVAHVEAGLRTWDLARPFPEEANRRLVATVASLHLAPTPWARANLLAERVPAGRIVVTGNTVVDALRTFLARPFRPATPAVGAALRTAADRRLVVVTTHRRENWGPPQERVARAVRRAALAHPDAVFLVPMHPNPLVRRALRGPLDSLPNVVLCEPLPYAEMVHVLSRAWVVLTDSGGIQEEGCALGVPVLLLREVTERPEGVLAGCVELVGTGEERVGAGLCRLLGDPAARRAMARASAVFGDGRAAERIRASLRRFLGLPAPQVEEFAPPELAEGALGAGAFALPGERR